MEFTKSKTLDELLAETPRCEPGKLFILPETLRFPRPYGYKSSLPISLMLAALKESNRPQ